MKLIRHVFEFPMQTVEIQIQELPNVVKVRIVCNVYKDFGYKNQLEALMIPIFEPYNSDNRPILMLDSNTKDEALMFGGENDVVIIYKPKV